MEADLLLRSLGRGVDLLQEAGLLLDSQPHTITATAAGESWVAFSGSGRLGATFDSYGLIEQYERSLRDRLFSAVLSDGALLQWSYLIHRRQVRKHRLAFIPCPLRLSAEELELLSLEDLLNYFGDALPRERIRLESSLRFDFDAESEAADHPPAHLTVSRPSCRIPVAAPMSLGHFLRFVVEHFYPAAWRMADALRTIGCEQVGPAIHPAATEKLYVSWRAAL